MVINMKICKGIYMVCGYTYSSIDNVYAIDTSEGTVLIDTGTDQREYDIIKENLSYWELGPVKWVIVTHAHINHCFNAKRFQEEGALIVCSTDVAEALETGSDRLIDYHDLALNYNTRLFQRLTPDVVIKESGIYKIAGIDFDMRITNGHSRGGLVFFCTVEGKRCMFTGDFIQIATANRHASAGWNGVLEFDRDAFLTELKELSNESPDCIFPGHGQQCLRDAWQMTKNAYVRAARASHQTMESPTGMR